MIRRVPLGAALFFVLVAVTIAVSVLVVRARTPDLVLEVLEPGRNFVFSPGDDGGRDAARITFFVRRFDPAAMVTIVDAHEDIVKTLDAEVVLEAEEAVTYRWDGTTDAGGLAVPGRYRLGVELPDSHREMIWPIRITLNEEGGEA